MNRRKFLVSSGTTILSGIGINALNQRPAVGVEFKLSGSDISEDPKEVSSILIDFEKLKITPQYTTENENLDVIASVEVGKYGPKKKNTTVSSSELTNGEIHRLSDDIGSILVDGLDFSGEDYISGSVTVSVEHPDVSDKYVQNLTITTDDVPETGVSRYTMDKSLEDVWNANNLQEDGATASYTTANKQGSHALYSNEIGYPKFSTTDSSIWNDVESSNQLTLCGWFKNSDSDQNYSAAIGTEANASSEILLEINPDDPNNLGTRFRTEWGSPGDSSMHSTGDWIFVAGRIKSDIVDVRVGTTTLDSVSTSGNQISGLDTPLILGGEGGYDGNEYTWNGDWDDLRVYSEYLTDGELDSIRSTNL